MSSSLSNLIQLLFSFDKDVYVTVKKTISCFSTLRKLSYKLVLSLIIISLVNFELEIEFWWKLIDDIVFFYKSDN